MYNDYPYTDFHSLNLDYLLKKYREVDSKVAGLRLSANGETNKIELLDSDGNVMNSITVPFATNATNATNASNAVNATHATSADAAQTASSATNASKDVNNKNITSYIADVTYSNNVMTFKDGVDNNVEQFTIDTSSSITEKIEGYYKSGETDLCDDNFAVGDSAVILTEYDEIDDLRNVLNEIYDGTLAAFYIFKNSDMDSLKQIGNITFVTMNYANATPELCVYVIYAASSGTAPYHTSIKWRLFLFDISATKIDGKVAYTLTRID